MRRPIDNAELQMDKALADLEAAQREQAAAREKLSLHLQSELKVDRQLRAQLRAQAAALDQILRNPVISKEQYEELLALRVCVELGVHALRAKGTGMGLLLTREAGQTLPT
eukprot:1152876-Pelagomonas_calceolata.AAC.3